MEHRVDRTAALRVQPRHPATEPSVVIALLQERRRGQGMGLSAASCPPAMGEKRSPGSALVHGPVPLHTPT